jgi:hypothetical protein
MLISLHRKYSQLMRILMLLSVMAFALGSIAHAGHEHSKERSQHQTCDYCVAYAHLAGSTAHSVDVSSSSFTDEAPLSFAQAFISLRNHLVAQPRAPPAL